MTAQIQSEHFTMALFSILDETFDNVHGYFLDQGTALFETLAVISAEEASIPIGNQCATLAAQVKHLTFYLDVLERYASTSQKEEVDWDEIWRTVKEVTPSEWESLKTELRHTYNRIRLLIYDTPVWPSEHEIGGAIAMIAHTAYHLGEIRQALCTLKPLTRRDYDQQNLQL